MHSDLAPTFQPPLSRRIERLESSLVRDILAAASRPGMVSFAGGLPAADLMPELGSRAPFDRSLYQYGTTEGEPAFREAIAAWVGEAGLQIGPQQVLALAGSQQGLDLAAKLLIDEGSTIVTETPAYLAALQVFNLFGARIAAVPLREEGPDLAALERLLDEARPRGVYLVPSFQNPSGVCYSPEARLAVAELLDYYRVCLIEDDPYRNIKLDVAHPMQPICAALKRAPWIYLGSFSKILWPGWRVGFLAASPELMPHLVRLKQASDLHTQRPGQMAVADWLRSASRDADIEQMIAGYRAKRDIMQASLVRHFGDIADWHLPRGGLFFWLRLRGFSATRATLDDALTRGVAFMPGEAFFPEAVRPTQFMRLNYSHATPEDMERGLAILSRSIREQASAPAI